MATVHNFQERIDALERKKHPPIDPPGGGGDNGDMELTQKVIRLEEKVTGMDKRLELVEKDLRELSKKIDGHFLALLGVMFGLAGLMAKGFQWI